MKKLNAYKSLAIEFINALLPVDRLKIRLRVQDKLQSIDSDLSYSKLLSELGLSYIASCDSSSKLVKGKQYEFSTLGLHLAPASKSGRNVCGFAGACKAPCLDESGRVLMEKLDLNHIHVAMATLHVCQLRRLCRHYTCESLDWIATATRWECGNALIWSA